MARSPTRREILEAFLGLPLALSAGCAPAPPGRLEGEIVGPSVELGHRLRDQPPPPPGAWRPVPVVIAGGGIAGLSAAWRLGQAGFEDYVLLELEPVLGGTSRSGAGSPVGYPWGAHYLPVPLPENRALLRLLTELGVVEGQDAQGRPVIAEQALCRDPQERVFYRGRWYEGLYLETGASADDLEQVQRFQTEVRRWAGWRDGKGRRAFAIPVASGSDDAEVTALDRLSMADWLDRRGLTSPRLRWLVDYACRDDYGLRLDQASAWAGLFYFAARLASADSQPQPLLTWPEGNGHIVGHLRRQVGTRAHTGHAVTGLEGGEAGRGVRVLAVEAATGQAVGYRAEQAILAVPTFLRPHLLRSWRDGPPAWAGAIGHGSWLVANLFLDGRPGEDHFPLCWDNVLYESPSLGYVAATHQRGIDHGPTIFTYYYPLCDENPRAARQRLLALGWRDCADVVLGDLRQAHPDLDGLVTRLDVMRWGHAMVQPRPGLVWGRARREASRPEGDIHFAHTDLSGVALFEEAFYHGLRAAEEVLAARGLPFTSLL